MRADDLDVSFDPDGNLVMYTRDTEATTQVRYQTVGWTIKRENREIAETQSARLVLSETAVERLDGGIVRTRFETDAKRVIRAIREVSPEWEESLLRNGGYVYLDAIMVVVRNGIATGGLNADGSTWGSVYFTRSGIMGAEAWRDPSGLATHFDKVVYYPQNRQYLEASLEVGYYVIDQDDRTIPLSYLGLNRREELEARTYTITAETLDAEHLSYASYEETLTGFDGGTHRRTGAEMSVTVDNSTFAYQSVQIAFYYRAVETEEELDFQYGRAYVEAENRVVLAAEPFDAPEFDVESGIPTGEAIGARAYLQRYYFALTVGKYTGYRFVTDAPPLPYVYYRIRALDLWSLDSGHLHNGAIEPEDIAFPGMEPLRIECVQDRESYVRAEDGAVFVRNDLLRIGETVILDGAWTKGEENGIHIPEEPELAESAAGSFTIPHTRSNRYYPSEADAVYVRYGGGTAETFPVQHVNGINVHTPVVCAGDISDDIAHNQQDVPTKAISLVLGRDFTVSLNTYGLHRDIPGYRRRDYEKYTVKKEVSFPFVVYEGDHLLEPDTWIDITEDARKYYLPIGVEEGDYAVRFRCYAANYQAAPSPGSELHANLKQENYFAYDLTSVHIMGRVYDLCITEIWDSPRWKLPEGFRYRVGRLSMEGEPIASRAEDPYAPLLYGSHPEDPQIGPVGLGYRVAFELKTIGSMREEDDAVILLPTYYYISRDGRSRRRVRLYGASDLSGIAESARLTAKDRTYRSSYFRNVADTEICDRSVQIWHGTYEISPDIVIVDADLDLDAYIAGRGGRLSRRDPVLLKGGYLLVSFEILTNNGGQINLNYANVKNEGRGYANMWKTQGFPYERTDAQGAQFRFADGDFLLFDTKFSIYADYESYGTH